MAFDVKSEILAEIHKTDDKGMRNVLLLMLGVLEAISDKIDTVMDDEKAMKHKVLNGHADQHHEDHEWIRARRKVDNCEKVCVWATKKIEEEDEASRTKKGFWRSFLDGLAKQSGSLIAGAIGAWLVIMFGK